MLSDRALVKLSTVWPVWPSFSSSGQYPRNCFDWYGLQCNKLGQVTSM